MHHYQTIANQEILYTDNDSDSGTTANPRYETPLIYVISYGSSRSNMNLFSLEHPLHLAHSSTAIPSPSAYKIYVALL
jgi:hypothetical protein